MRTIVESFKRLYKAGRITKEYLQGKVADGTITQSEYNFIIGG